jgi:hypothetical protein
MGKMRGVEKRKFQRLEAPLDVTLTVLPGEEPADTLRPFKAKSLNISPEGICLETSHIMLGTVNMLSGSPGAREHHLQMDIALPSAAEPLRATGEVCWYDISRESDDFGYQVGVVFHAIEGDGAQRLRTFLAAQKKPRGFLQSLWSIVHP